MLLEDTKTEKLSRLDGLRRDRGTALLDKGKIPPDLEDMIRQTEGAISAIDEAIGEQTRRDRAAADKAQQHARQGLVQDLKDAEAKRLLSITRAHAAYTELVEAINGVLQSGSEVGRICVALNKGRPMGFSEPEIELRISGWLAEALFSIKRRYRFGHLSWATSAEAAFARDAKKTWLDCETQLGARAIDPIINPEKETK